MKPEQRRFLEYLLDNRSFRKHKKFIEGILSNSFYTPSQQVILNRIREEYIIWYSHLQKWRPYN